MKNDLDKLLTLAGRAAETALDFEEKMLINNLCEFFTAFLSVEETRIKNLNNLAQPAAVSPGENIGSGLSSADACRQTAQLSLRRKEVVLLRIRANLESKLAALYRDADPTAGV